ncbi:hypothetical protein [Paenibacillus sp. UNC499MF]|uniref:hypothetical protein n=1 Tax=Paenibacillus sp. UNC499MF TaxID=1502751 RepID=UPI0008A04C97|nr:hypothetical protein [Paenibacillus sp. UNC499MF]SEG80096.1 hypothetical protein SAMN02799616_05263 [Paenibacillus sp. UNC499MF]
MDWKLGNSLTLTQDVGRLVNPIFVSEDEVLLMGSLMRIEELDKLFKKSKLPFRYSVKDAEKILRDKFNTLEIDIEIVDDLKKDPLVNYENIIKCYRVNDCEILSALFNDNGRSMHAEIRQCNANEPVTNSEITESVLLWRDIQEGKFPQLVLESADRSIFLRLLYRVEAKNVR